MANCSGKRKTAGTGTTSCSMTLHKCKKCDNVGCNPGGSSVSCTNQGFLNGKCLKCGGNQNEVLN
jgi:hypothetical protein